MVGGHTAGPPSCGISPAATRPSRASASPSSLPIAPIGFALLAAVAISVTNVATALHYAAGSNPVTFLLARYVLFVGALGLWLVASGRLRPLAAEHRVHLWGAGLLNAAGASSLSFAIERLPVALAIAILYLFPLFTLLIDHAVRRERPSLGLLAALVAAFAGLALALDVRAAVPDPVGVGFALFAAISIAASFVWVERRLGAMSDLVRTFRIGVAGLAFAVVLAAGTRDVVWPFPSVSTWTTLLVASATFGIAYLAMFRSVSVAGATLTSLIMNLEPPVTVVLAWLVLGDSLRAVQLVGIAITIAAVATAQRLAARPGPGARTGPVPPGRPSAPP